MPVLALLGPTAVGKTVISLRIAQALNYEIISLDSVQVYRRMNIGTAKIRPEEMQGIAHHCLDLVEPDDEYNAARYAADASAAMATIRDRGKIPLLVGGAGLYLRALEHGLFAAPPVDTNIRKKMILHIDKEGIDKLHDELVVCDHESAARIDRHDRSRVLRALEIYHATGLTWPEHLRRQQRRIEVAHPCTGRERAAPVPVNHFIKIGLNCPRDLLYQRINERCQIMLNEGLIEEARGLLAAGYSPACKALQAIGYRHVIAWLLGQNDYEKMVEIFMRDTRRYAKRQLTWFRHDPAITWFDWQDEKSILQFAAEALKKVVGGFIGGSTGSAVSNCLVSTV
ncbi:MAG: tRNA (adenosine(37)-N6)-dimethylallyltransferase MiaA [Desulfobulbaceae bacterium]|nr:tRNA (adenosine(37)-N6)-dimethylallyltransferase MiaA [Desulfobulbaceae bacterium]